MIDKSYKTWLTDLKGKIRSAQIKAAVSVNTELIALYWDMGKMITEKQTAWGTGFLEQLSKDLKTEFPGMQGFSRRNLSNTVNFYQFYIASIVQQPVGLIWQQPVAKLPVLENDVKNQQPVDQLQTNSEIVKQPDGSIVQHAVAQIPWGHNILIFSKSKDVYEANFYVHQTIENNWSRDVLGLQIKSGLYQRKGKAITNFSHTLPKPLSDLAEQTLKDPYVFDFMTLSKPYQEKDIENQLIKHIAKFLLELGKGFAFVGQQYHLEIAGNDYYIDLLFYHIKLKCYLVIELKNTKFIPEYAGKLNFYLSAVDSLLKQSDDKSTIGLILCRDKNNIEAEFALRDMNKPMGVSEFNLTEILPEELKSSLPTIEEIENELKYE